MNETDLGPLPTDFATALNCADDSNVYQVFTTYQPGVYYVIQGPVEQTSCYPSGYVGNRDQFYSPGRCPTGFTAACQSVNTAATVTETVVTCCPTQWNFTCLKSVIYPWHSTLGCYTHLSSDAPLTLVASQVSDGITSRVTSTFDSNDGFNAYSIQVRYQSTDFLPTTTSPPSSTTAASTVPSTSTSQAEPMTSLPAANTSSANESGLDSGTIAGIVIGTVAGVTVSLFIAFFLITRAPRGALRKIFVGPPETKEPVRRPRTQQFTPPQNLEPDCPLSPQELQGRQSPQELEDRESPQDLEDRNQKYLRP